MALPIALRGFIERIELGYRQLEPREQLITLGLTAFFVVLVLVFGLWLPLYSFVSDGSSRFEKNLELVQWMRSTEAQAREQAGAAHQRMKSGQSLLTLVSRSARAAGIKANKLQPEGDDSVSVWFDSVAFNELVIWLEKLEAEEEVRVFQLSVNRFGAPGMVNARLVVRG